MYADDLANTSIRFELGRRFLGHTDKWKTPTVEKINIDTLGTPNFKHAYYIEWF